MQKNISYELVSFDICPYVQRSVITLKHKKVDFKLTFIDLQNTPEWFNKISPLGKVPLLLVRDSSTGTEPTVLFESAVIIEYLDEVTPPPILSQESLRKAQERGWIAVSGELFSFFHTIIMAGDEAEITEAKTDLWDTFSHVEKAISGKITFSSRGFTLVDSAFAPLFMRLLMIQSFRDDDHWKALPKTLHWAQSLLALPEVKDSVIPEFKQRQKEFLIARESSFAAEII